MVKDLEMSVVSENSSSFLYVIVFTYYCLMGEEKRAGKYLFYSHKIFHMRPASCSLVMICQILLFYHNDSTIVSIFFLLTLSNSVFFIESHVLLFFFFLPPSFSCWLLWPCHNRGLNKLDMLLRPGIWTILVSLQNEFNLYFLGRKRRNVIYWK